MAYKISSNHSLKSSTTNRMPSTYQYSQRSLSKVWPNDNSTCLTKSSFDSNLTNNTLGSWWRDDFWYFNKWDESTNAGGNIALNQLISEDRLIDNNSKMTINPVSISLDDDNKEKTVNIITNSSNIILPNNHRHGDYDYVFYFYNKTQTSTGWSFTAGFDPKNYPTHSGTHKVSITNANNEQVPLTINYSHIRNTYIKTETQSVEVGTPLSGRSDKATIIVQSSDIIREQDISFNYSDLYLDSITNISGDKYEIKIKYITSMVPNKEIVTHNMTVKNSYDDKIKVTIDINIYYAILYTNEKININAQNIEGTLQNNSTYIYIQSEPTNLNTSNYEFINVPSGYSLSANLVKTNNIGQWKCTVTLNSAQKIDKSFTAKLKVYNNCTYMDQYIEIPIEVKCEYWYISDNDSDDVLDLTGATGGKTVNNTSDYVTITASSAVTYTTSKPLPNGMTISKSGSKYTINYKPDAAGVTNNIPTTSINITFKNETGQSKTLTIKYSYSYTEPSYIRFSQNNFAFENTKSDWQSNIIITIYSSSELNNLAPVNGMSNECRPSNYVNGLGYLTYDPAVRGSNTQFKYTISNSEYVYKFIIKTNDTIKNAKTFQNARIYLEFENKEGVSKYLDGTFTNNYVKPNSLQLTSIEPNPITIKKSDFYNPNNPEVSVILTMKSNSLLYGLNPNLSPEDKKWLSFRMNYSDWDIPNVSIGAEFFVGIKSGITINDLPIGNKTINYTITARNNDGETLDIPAQINFIDDSNLEFTNPSAPGTSESNPIECIYGIDSPNSIISFESSTPISFDSNDALNNSLGPDFIISISTGSNNVEINYMPSHAGVFTDPGDYKIRIKNKANNSLFIYIKLVKDNSYLRFKNPSVAGSSIDNPIEFTKNVNDSALIEFDSSSNLQTTAVEELPTDNDAVSFGTYGLSYNINPSTKSIEIIFAPDSGATSFLPGIYKLKISNTTGQTQTIYIKIIDNNPEPTEYLRYVNPGAKGTSEFAPIIFDSPLIVPIKFESSSPININIIPPAMTNISGLSANVVGYTVNVGYNGKYKGTNVFKSNITVKNATGQTQKIYITVMPPSKQ